MTNGWPSSLLLRPCALCDDGDATSAAATKDNDNNPDAAEPLSSRSADGDVGMLSSTTASSKSVELEDIPLSEPATRTRTRTRKAEYGSDTVVAPWTGLYGLCFGDPEASYDSLTGASLDGPLEGDSGRGGGGGGGKRRREEASSVMVRTVSEVKTKGVGKSVAASTPDFEGTEGVCCVFDGRSSHRADFVPPRGGCRRSIWLPLPAGKVNPTIFRAEGVCEVLVSTKIGRLIYLPKNTRVTVHCCGHACIPGRDGEKDGITCSSGYEDGDKRATFCGLRWHLVLHKKISRCNDQAAPDDDDVDLYPEEGQKKPLVCAACGRRFPSPASVRTHALSAHSGTGIDGGGRVADDSPLRRGISAVTSAPTAVSEMKDWRRPAALCRPLRVVYADDAMAVVVKPQGVSVMGERWTLAKSDLFLPLAASPNSDKALRKPCAVHRLDSATGGLLIVAKTKPAEVALRRCFEDRICWKRYRAIVFGRLDPDAAGVATSNDAGPLESFGSRHDETRSSISVGEGLCRTPIGGKESLTRFKIVCYTRCLHPCARGWLTTVDLFPTTGRKHQLRKHMKALGHPIWGDRRYGPYSLVERREMGGNEMSDAEEVEQAEGISTKDNPHQRLLLWAVEISLPHPLSREEKTFAIEEPKWLKWVREHEENQWLRSNNNKLDC